MSEEQLAAFWAAVKADASLQETLKGAADLDAAVAVAKEAGFDVSKADLRDWRSIKLGLSDEELGAVVGGVGSFVPLLPWGDMDPSSKASVSAMPRP